MKLPVHISHVSVPFHIMVRASGLGKEVCDGLSKLGVNHSSLWSSASRVLATITLVAAVCMVGLASVRHDATPVEMESLIAQEQHTRHRGSAGDHVSSEQLVGDIKKLLTDVESNIKYRRERRKEHPTPSPAKARSASHDDDTNLGKNLDEVNHMMDGLQKLAAGGGDDGPSFHSFSAPSAHRGRHEVSHKKIGAEQRLNNKLSDLSNAGVPGTQKGKPADKKKAAILAKMKALQQQIEGDFKKVTGFGKQAGYVPPPKIPQM